MYSIEGSTFFLPAVCVFEPMQIPATTLSPYDIKSENRPEPWLCRSTSSMSLSKMVVCHYLLRSVCLSLSLLFGNHSSGNSSIRKEMGRNPKPAQKSTTQAFTSHSVSRCSQFRCHSVWSPKLRKRSPKP